MGVMGVQCLLGRSPGTEGIGRNLQTLVRYTLPRRRAGPHHPHVDTPARTWILRALARHTDDES